MKSTFYDCIQFSLSVFMQKEKRKKKLVYFLLRKKKHKPHSIELKTQETLCTQKSSLILQEKRTNHSNSLSQLWICSTLSLDSNVRFVSFIFFFSFLFLQMNFWICYRKFYHKNNAFVSTGKFLCTQFSLYNENNSVNGFEDKIISSIDKRFTCRNYTISSNIFPSTHSKSHVSFAVLLSRCLKIQR